ncbi:MAG TPA: prolipoprotein diacylglyceryl transferase family protein [Terracidiphilus sp.]|jgi:phosphatidylglycerol:prolipoprotein diacylglycerol transferase
MIPFLHIWFLNIKTFGLMAWVASMVAAVVMDRSFRRARVTVNGQGADAISIVAITLVAGIAGAKLWHVLDSPGEFHYLGWAILWDSAGFAWFGGLVFGISALLIQGWRAKIGALRTLDLAAPAAAIGYGIGRIGCFLSGDGCYGIEIKPVHFFSFTFKPWGMAFPNGIEPVFVPVYPTPLYELTAGLLIGSWLWWRAGKPQAVGAIVGQYLLLTGAARFLVEFLRRNPRVLWGLSNAQLASVGSVIAGLLLLAWTAKRAKLAPDALPLVESAL